MRIGQLDGEALGTQLSSEGLTASIGPFSVRFRSPLPAVADYISSHYGAFPVLDQEGCHIAIDVDAAGGLRTLAVGGNTSYSGSVTAETPTGDVGVPEPASMLLLGTGLVGAASRLRRRKA